MVVYRRRSLAYSSSIHCHSRSTEMSQPSYYTLGKSGLRVSRLALGVMTFGTEWGWGSDKAAAQRIFGAYVEHGGNFIDTADAYTGGTSERWLGEFARGQRDRLVIASKYTF